MPKKNIDLYKLFKPEKYKLVNNKLKIVGKKVGPPSKRITLHQKGLKITEAQIVRHDKKGDQQFEVARINHLPTMQQVRLHTSETLFPGYYEITLNFSPKRDLKSNLPNRELFPCIDEPEAWANASPEIVNSSGK